MVKAGGVEVLKRGAFAFLCDVAPKWSRLEQALWNWSAKDTLDFVILKKQTELNDAV